jgi:acetoin utilization deacetylase AcuC-like enzyme
MRRASARSVSLVAEMVERSRRSAGATIAACRTALEQGIAVNLAGGTHHAYADKGGGFAYSTTPPWRRVLQRDGRVSRVAVIDLDVHQGNGTASILRRRNDLHAVAAWRENYPFRKEASDLDVGLPDGCDDALSRCARAGARHARRTLRAGSADLPGGSRSP